MAHCEQVGSHPSHLIFLRLMEPSVVINKGELIVGIKMGMLTDNFRKPAKLGVSEAGPVSGHHLEGETRPQYASSLVGVA